MKKICFLFATAVMLCGCREKAAVGEHASFFVQPVENETEILVENLAVEAIPVGLNDTSWEGFSGMTEDKIFFVDRYAGRLYEVDGESGSTELRIREGRGPQELPIENVEGYTASHDGHHYFVGATRDLYIFDPTYNLIKNISFIAAESDSPEIDYNRDDYYSLVYEAIVLRPYKNHVYINVMSAGDDSNISNESWYDNSRILMSVSTEGSAHSIEGYMGRVSPAVRYMTAFYAMQYDLDAEGNFYVSFEADPLVYVYDNDYRIQYSFGHPGKGMNTDYTEGTPDNFGDLLDSEYANKGYYTSIKKVGDLVFRSYRRGGADVPDGLQIYRGTTLVGDVEVPRGLKVMGYIAPYYYSEVVTDPENEAATLYRFRLDI